MWPLMSLRGECSGQPVTGGCQLDPVSVIVQGAMYPRGAPSAHGLPAWGLAVRQGECLPSTHGPARPRSTSAGSSPVDTNSPLVPASENTRLPVLVFHRHSLGKGLFSVWSRNSPASGVPLGAARRRAVVRELRGGPFSPPAPRGPERGRERVGAAELSVLAVAQFFSRKCSLGPANSSETVAADQVFGVLAFLDVSPFSLTPLDQRFLTRCFVFPQPLASRLSLTRVKIVRFPHSPGLQALVTPCVVWRSPSP